MHGWLTIWYPAKGRRLYVMLPSSRYALLSETRPRRWFIGCLGGYQIIKGTSLRSLRVIIELSGCTTTSFPAWLQPLDMPEKWQHIP